jgi:UDP-3-O-[3-hydroxymyristoyl] glucosamine N-acyltransferase
MNEIHVVEKGDIVFVDHPKYYTKALNSAATVILINKRLSRRKSLIDIRRSFSDFNRLTNHFKPFESAVTSISTSAIVGQGTIIQCIYWKSSGNWKKLFDSP